MEEEVELLSEPPCIRSVQTRFSGSDVDGINRSNSRKTQIPVTWKEVVILSASFFSRWMEEMRGLHYLEEEKVRRK